MAKRGQYGLNGIMAYPVTTNTADTYVVGEAFQLPEAQECAAEIDVAEGDIYADDKVYYHARKEKGATITLTLAELPLELKAKVAGGVFDEGVKKYTFPEGSLRPTIALRTVVPFVDDSGWHIEYATVCDVLAVEMAGNKVTRSDGVEVNGVNIILYSRARELDKVRVIEYDPESQADFDAAEADFVKGSVPTP